MSCEPLYRGAEADRIRDLVRAIAADVASGAGEHRVPSDLALFWAYVAGEIEDDAVQSAYDAAVADVFESIASKALTTRLYGGLAGAGWVLAHVSEPGAADPALAVIDAALASAIATCPGFDLIGGLAGSAVYFLERLRGSPVPLARDALDQIVRRLEQTCIHTAEGVAWPTPSELLTDEQRRRWPPDPIDCGVAHGAAGVVAVLAKIAALPEPPRGARELCTGGLAWLEARRGPEPTRRYPAVVGAGTAIPARAAWCYGDPGVVAARWLADASLGAPTTADIAAAAECIERSVATCGVEDAGLCHGATGLAHICHRFYRASGETRFADAARAWFARAIEMRGPEGLGGFAALVRQDSGTAELRPNAELLGGAAGVALALLAAIRDDEPGWDRLLLCDLPWS